jgi:hypothetical protein
MTRLEMCNLRSSLDLRRCSLRHTTADGDVIRATSEIMYAKVVSVSKVIVERVTQCYFCDSVMKDTTGRYGWACFSSLRPNSKKTPQNGMVSLLPTQTSLFQTRAHTFYVSCFRDTTGFICWFYFAVGS